MFSRGTQQLGGMAAAVLYGAALGAVFTVAYAAVRHRLRAADDWRAAVVVAAAGFAGVFLLPFLKYPANPPAVGDPDTIGRRTALYLWRWPGRSWPRGAAGGRGGRSSPAACRCHTAVPATLATGSALAVVGLVVLPSNPDPVEAPATLIWQFRLATVAGAAAFWSVMGMVFGWLRVRGVTHVVVQGCHVHDRA